jgi:hypothetical protein
MFVYIKNTYYNSYYIKVINLFDEKYKYKNMICDLIFDIGVV